MSIFSPPHYFRFHRNFFRKKGNENCSFDGWDSEIFKSELEKLLAYLNPTGNAKAIITTGFWHHCGDEAIPAFAGERGVPLVELGDLGEMDEMKAIGLFEHGGVANHPGDLSSGKPLMIAQRGKQMLSHQ